MFLDIFYNIAITPIELLIEFVFSIVNRFANNPGVAIIGVSLVVNFLVLPLYKKSDALSEIERDKQKTMKPWLDHIKKAFKGDERYMMTQTYYRQQSYKPIYALRSSISLLLQIPFFIAAYHYLSNLELLKDTSFLVFSNLGEPDQLIPFIGGVRLNLLPILMTTINIVSGAVYTKGFPLKEKLQLYGMALIFLVLLYDSPSGLVFYWTLNNIFSLCKNLVMKVIKLPKREKKIEPVPIDKKIFFLGTVFLTLFMGAFVPLSVMSASPTEFVNDNYGPMTLFVNTLSVYVGFWLVWVSIFYYLASQRVKNIFTYIVWIFAVLAVVNFYAFDGDYGAMSSSLVFDEGILTSKSYIIVNALVMITGTLALIIILKKWKNVAKAVCSIMIIACVGLSIYNVIDIQSEITIAEESEAQAKSKRENMDGALTLSKNGKNVIVIMLDRAVGEYLSKIIEEKPEVATSLAGFTYYKNTLSFAGYTNMAMPVLYGGYEYTPANMNKRVNESLKDKTNEAILVLPSIFKKEKYNSTMCDISYAGDYAWTTNMNVFEDYGINGYTTIGAYSNTETFDDNGYNEAFQKRNFVCYSILRSTPVATRGYLYTEGDYLTTLVPQGVGRDFWNSYSTLKNLSKMTNIEKDGNNFIVLQNETTHSPVDLNEEYEPDVNISMGTRHNHDASMHYDVNMAAILKVCDWMDYLRSQGVYDNSRIIICSDHSFTLDDESDMTFEEIDLDAQIYNPLLLVKNFGETEFKTSDEFMTNADVPTLATDGLISNPTNPFTGNAINSDAKTNEDLLVTTSSNYDVSVNNGNIFDTSDGEWWQVTGNNIFDYKNWKKVD